MVNIALTNKNPQSQAQDGHVIINIVTGLCSFTKGREVELKRLKIDTDFSHPLIMEQFTPSSDHFYHYEYDDVDGLLYSAIYVYSILLQVNNPLICQFKINPSPKFQHSAFNDEIYFSVNSQKPAKEAIKIKQLEAFVSHLSGSKFEFSEDLIIDDLFTIKDLPPSIDGDTLYDTNDEIIDLLKHPKDFSRYEVRYISPEIGLGVFSRDQIKKGDIIAIYTGKKSTQFPEKLKYVFVHTLDGLQMYTDACNHGNIARFINHAPAPGLDGASHPIPLHEANIRFQYYYINGMKIIVLVTVKDILEGGQLFVDYGELYFGGRSEVIRFTKNGKQIDNKNRIIRSNSPKKLEALRIMASLGIKKAESYLRSRMIMIFVVSTLVIEIINHTIP